jgi:hypothetical protein
MLSSPGAPTQSPSTTTATTTTRLFEFDAVLPPRCEQAAVFDCSGVKEYIDAALQGYAATVFAYGQTGSG